MKRVWLLFFVLFTICAVSLGFTLSAKEYYKPITSSVNIADIPKSDEAYAYYEIFKQFNEEIERADSTKYLALDISKMIYDADLKQNLIAIFLDYCDKNDYTLLMDTWDGLKKHGYISRNGGFDEGFLISFYDREIDDNRLVVRVLSDRGTTYTVELIDGEWQITDISSFGVA